MVEAVRNAVLSGGLMTLTDWYIALAILIAPLTMHRRGL